MAIDVNSLARQSRGGTTSARNRGGRQQSPDDDREVRRAVQRYDQEFADYDLDAEYQRDDAPPKPSRWGRKNSRGDDQPRKDKPSGRGIAGIVIPVFIILLTIAGTAIALWQSVLTTPTSTNALKYIQITQAIAFVQVLFLFLYVIDLKRNP